MARSRLWSPGASLVSVAIVGGLTLLAPRRAEAAYVWAAQQAELTVPVVAATPHLGSSVALQGDTLVAGAYGMGAYVFVRSGDAWTQQARLDVSGTPANCYFGWSVALDADTALVATPTTGAHVFVRSGATWALQAELVPIASCSSVSDQAVGVRGDTAVVTSRVPASGGALGQSAAVFVRSGATWSSQAQLGAGLAASSASGGATPTPGTRVSVGVDRFVVGAPADAAGDGAAYVFVRSGTTWSLEAKLVPASPGGAGSFAAGVALDGDTIALTAYAEKRVHLFARTGATWAEQGSLALPDAPASVDLSGDTVVVGLPGVPAVYFATRIAGIWSSAAQLTPAGAGSGSLGRSVAVSGGTAVAGDPTKSADVGAVYVLTGALPCSVPSDCASGFCVDAVCCTSACTGQCQACAEPGSVGVCSDVSGSPRTPRAACDGAGTKCAGECVSGACTFPGSEISCGATCADGSSQTCDATGHCGACAAAAFTCSADGATSIPVDPSLDPTPCAPYRCDATSGRCATQCTSAAACATDATCQSGACVVTPAAPSSGGCAIELEPGRGLGARGWLALAAALAATWWTRRRGASRR